jgi:ribosome-associated protein
MTLEEKIEIIKKSLDHAVVQDIRVYDMREKTPFYDMCVIASVMTSRQGQAAANYLEDDAQKNGFEIRGISGGDESTWFLVDFGDVLVHLFVGDDRERYNLDQMLSVSNQTKIEA